MNTPKHHKWISGALLICSIVSLLFFFLQWRYFPTPPGTDAQALAAAFSGERSSLEMYSLFTGGAIPHSRFGTVSGLLVPTIL